MPRQPGGPCNTPHIPNGQAVVPGNRRYLQHGETLQVQCDEGFTLTGEIQRLFIVPFVRAPILVGRDYTHFYKSAIRGFPCDNRTTINTCLQIVALF